MHIKTLDLKRFQKLAAHIKGAGMLPIHGYLKFGGGGICKNVNTSFVRFDLPEATDEILVSENDLYSLLGVSQSSFIDITTLKNGKIQLNDGKDKISMQSPKMTEFSEPPTPSSDKVELSADFTDALFRATSFAIFEKGMPEYYGCVHIGEKTVCAGNGIIAYHCPVDESVQMVLEGPTAKFVASLEPIAYSFSNNYHYFFVKEGLLGFSRLEIGWFDIRRIFNNEREYAFTLDSSDVISFNQLSLKLSENPLVTISNGKLEMNDMLLDKYHERVAENLKISTPFNYNPERMNTVLTGLGGSEIEFHEAKPCYFLTHKDTKATAIIAKIAK